MMTVGCIIAFLQDASLTTTAARVILPAGHIVFHLAVLSSSLTTALSKEYCQARRRESNGETTHILTAHLRQAKK